MQEIKKDMYLIDKAELLQVIMEKKNALWRLCQICCSFPKAENHYEVTYSFANGYDFANYRLIVEKDEDVPSISRVYKSTIYYENEMHDLFGIKFLHNALDYNGNFFVTAEPTPWNPKK